MTPPDAPRGFVRLESASRCLLVEATAAAAFRELGLDRESGWTARLDADDAVVSRGAIARIDLPDGTPLLLKQLRRGGAAARLWRNRFPGTRRLLDNLRVPLESIARGVPTPRPVALLIVSGPPGLFRGWLAQQALPGAVDLATRLGEPDPLDPETRARVMAMVREAHDAGLEHRDLNLGNLLLSDGAPYVIDLDGARLHHGPLGFPLRQRALRRLERSCAKLLGDGGQTDPHGWIYELYAGGDARLAQRLARGRAAGRLRLRLHRLTWSR